MTQVRLTGESCETVEQLQQSREEDRAEFERQLQEQQSRIDNLQAQLAALGVSIIYQETDVQNVTQVRLPGESCETVEQLQQSREEDRAEFERQRQERARLIDNLQGQVRALQSRGGGYSRGPCPIS